MSKTENKKIARKKKSAPLTNEAKEQAELKEMLKEFDGIQADGYAAVALSTGLAAEAGKKVGDLIKANAMNKNGLTLATNFSNISKAIAILKADMDGIKDYCNYDYLIQQADYNRSFTLLTAGQQLAELILICQNKVVPAIALLDEQYNAYMEDKDGVINTIVIAPSYTVGEDGKTNEMTDEDAATHIQESVLE